MRTGLLFVLCFFICPFFSASQDSAKSKIRFTHQFEILGRQHFYSYYSKIKMPLTIKETRRNFTKLPINFDSVTDNPFRHGAMYAAFRSTISIRDKVTVQADLYGEYRGFSYGTHNLKNNLLVYPVLSIYALDTLTIGNSKWIVDGRAGQFLNEKTGEGWMIYNVDVQGTQARIRYGNHRIGFTIFGNLEPAPGLGIDDLKEFNYEYLFNNDSARIGLAYTIASPGVAAKYHSYYSAFASLLTKTGTRWYIQGGFTTVFPDFAPEMRGFASTTGGVIGVEKELVKRKIAWKNNIELRYYGSLFNVFHASPGNPYRDSAHNEYEMYANTTGEFLYPLRKFDTPFSQWAVFTEYSYRNVVALSAAGSFRYHGSPKCSWFVDYDINVINAVLEKYYSTTDGRRSFFVYPFFKTGLQYHPVPEISVAAFLTNKSMNLDIHYPTHYLHRKPFVAIEIHCKI